MFFSHHQPTVFLSERPHDPAGRGCGAGSTRGSAPLLRRREERATNTLSRRARQGKRQIHISDPANGDESDRLAIHFRDKAMSCNNPHFSFVKVDGFAAPGKPLRIAVGCSCALMDRAKADAAERAQSSDANALIWICVHVPLTNWPPQRCPAVPPSVSAQHGYQSGSDGPVLECSTGSAAVEVVDVVAVSAQRLPKPASRCRQMLFEGFSQDLSLTTGFGISIHHTAFGRQSCSLSQYEPACFRCSENNTTFA